MCGGTEAKWEWGREARVWEGKGWKIEKVKAWRKERVKGGVVGREGERRCLTLVGERGG